MTMTIGEATADSVRNFLGGNFKGTAVNAAGDIMDGYMIVKTLERMITLAVIREDFDAYDMVGQVWDELIEPEFAQVRGISNFVDDFLPHGQEGYTRDAIREVVEEIAEGVEA